MRFQTILLAALIAGHAGCERAPRPEVIAAGAQLVAAEPVSGWPGTKNVSRAGRIFFAGQPGEAALRQAAAEGVALVINSRTAQEMTRVPFDEPALVAALGMQYVVIPVTPSTFSAADVDRFAEALAATDGPVLFHCATANRSGGLWAAYLVRKRGLPWERALDLGRAAGLSRQSMIEAARRVAESPERPPA